MDENKSKVYALIDEEGLILRIEGGYTIGNIEDISKWTYLEEGYGDRYNLCQSNYLPKSIRDDRGVCRYKLVDGEVVERTQEEMDDDYIPPIPEPTIWDELKEAYEKGVNEVG